MREVFKEIIQYYIFLFINIDLKNILKVLEDKKEEKSQYKTKTSGDAQLF